MLTFAQMRVAHGNAFLRVHADCVPVMGTAKAAIYDLTRHQIFLIPGGYYRLLEGLTSAPLANVLAEVESNAHAPKVLAFVQYLLEHELADFIDDPTSFPALANHCDISGLIQNAIIDVDVLQHDFATLFQELDETGCRHLQLRCFSTLLGAEELRTVLALVTRSELESVELVLKYDPSNCDDTYAALAADYPKVSGICVHSAPAARELRVDLCGATVSHPMFKRVRFLTKPIGSELDCGVIDAQGLNAPSVDTFQEARSYNGCLNRKIAIDRQGQIRNCPSLTRSFGSAGKRRLKVVAQASDFQQAWSLAKDKVEVCRGCELRYACSDCRAYLERPNDLLSKPLKCGYDPATGVWSDWRTDAAKQAAIASYQFHAVDAVDAGPDASDSAR
ncbi:MAG: grasp-with-spasm system domain peptide maturase [Pseudomonadota bacterium]|jgi:SPASM domain peptide maturase of grasp-with-spasm system